MHNHTIIGGNEHGSLRGTELILGVRYVGLKRSSSLSESSTAASSALPNTRRRYRTLHCATAFNWPCTSRGANVDQLRYWESFVAMFRLAARDANQFIVRWL